MPINRILDLYPVILVSRDFLYNNYCSVSTYLSISNNDTKEHFKWCDCYLLQYQILTEIYKMMNVQKHIEWNWMIDESSKQVEINIFE